MFASIFIPTGNRADSLKRVLESLEKQTFKDFEIIIVDYKSTDTTDEVIQSFRNRLKITVLNQTQKGLSRAANMALNVANGIIFVRTDDDVIMKPYWMKAIYDSFQSDKNIGGVTGPTVIPKEYANNRDLFVFEERFKNGSFFWKILGKIYFGYFMEGNPRRVSHWYGCGAFSLGSNFEAATKEPVQEVTNLEACNFAVRTKLLKQIGGFDLHYGGVGEYHEADASFKIKELGYKLIFNPKAYLNHCPSQDGFFNDRPESYSRMVNFIVFYLRHIKAKSLSKMLRLLSYVAFLNAYYIYMAISHRQKSQLGAIGGTIAGVVQYWKLKNKHPHGLQNSKV